MKKTTTYTIEELLRKNSGNKELQEIDWTKKKDDVEFALSSILGGDWSVHKKNKTVTELWLTCPPSTSTIVSVMKKITIEVSDERYQDIQDRFAIDFGWEWNDNKDFAKQFSQWVVMQALDLDLDDCEE